MTSLNDKDLISMQEARNCVLNAKEAHAELKKLDQTALNRIVCAMSDAALQHTERLAKLAQDETGFGRWQDKTIKNYFAAKMVYDAIKDMPVIGILREDTQNKVLDIGVSVGVICGIVPSTNPTSTVIFKALIALKSGNCIVFAPHPNAKNAICETVRLLSEAAEAAGCPKGAISTLQTPTLQGTQEIMRHPFVSLILATGGPDMVRSAYSAGKPAIGVGAGNGPAFIDKSADISAAVRRIFDSKTFDNGTICAAEQSIIVERAVAPSVEAEMQKQGGCILCASDAEKLQNLILRPNGTMNPKIVGKSAADIAKLAHLTQVPNGTRILLARETKVGPQVPFSHEKLAPILAYYTEDSVQAVLEKTITILQFEGAGHTFSIHAADQALIRQFALSVPASRILVNTASSLGGIGATTNLFPSLTLGCGAAGGSSSSNNIGPLDIVNIRRIAYGVRETHDLGIQTGTQTDNEQMLNSIIEAVMQKLTQ